MIKFIEIEKESQLGEVFDGMPPYIHWYENGLSTSLIYPKKICFISDSPSIRCFLDENDVFKLIDTTGFDDINFENKYDENISGFKYLNINNLYTESRIFRGYKYKNYYIYCIYIVASSDEAGEYICNLHLGEYDIKIGASFYDENEILHINLSNMGTEIPEAIQKAVYVNNVHEDYIDNILINRKWKELISNYWDILAGRGSYKSLINSLKWFEWGDLVKIKEIWKNSDTGKYQDSDIKMISKSFEQDLCNLSKTTYISLNCARQFIKSEYDEEKNPTLEYVSFLWSWEDISLKLCLLGNFFESYFMPIHLDLIRSTIEDLVFSTTIKQIFSHIYERQDLVNLTKTFQCNIKSGSRFVLNYVNCQADENTIFGTKFDSKYQYICGVKSPTISDSIDTDSQYKTFAINHYGGSGSIVEFICSFELPENDYIYKEDLYWKPATSETWISNTSNIIVKNSELKFNLLFINEGEYDLRFQFTSLSGIKYTKRIVIKILDVSGCKIGVYKIKRIEYIDGKIPESSWDNQIGINYWFSRQVRSYTDSYKPIKQYLPVISQKNFNASWEGLCLNHCLIFEVSDFNTNSYLNENYFITTKTTSDKKYLICISKEFWFEPNMNKLPSYSIYRSEYIYIPQFHKLEELGDFKNPESYNITIYDSIVMIPEFVYSKELDDWEWEIRNDSLGMKGEFEKLDSIKTPIIASTDKYKSLSPGYYSIKFTYKIGNNKQSININSIFHII